MEMYIRHIYLVLFLKLPGFGLLGLTLLPIELYLDLEG